MDKEEGASESRKYKPFDASRRRRGKKRSGNVKQKAASNKKEDDINAETSDLSEEDGSTEQIPSDGDGQLAFDAVVSNEPRIQPEVVTATGSTTYPEEAFGYTETATTPNFEKEITSPVTTPIESGSENIISNTRPLSKDATTYQLEKFEKNAMIIFNQINIKGYANPRCGTENDAAAITKTFEKFGFEVTEHVDLDRKDIFAELEKFTKRDFTDYGCIGVTIMTHGSDDGLLRARDEKYSETEVMNFFKVHNKPTLVTKPKLLFIQACRGTKISKGVPVFHSGKFQKDVDDEVVKPYVLPAEADMLILHSSYIGNASIRHVEDGSWFIQSLCRKINELSSTMDLESIATEVKREVAIDRAFKEYNRRTRETEINKQIPVLTSTLIRKLYLRKHGDEPGVPQTPVTFSDSSRNEVLDSEVIRLLPAHSETCLCFLEHFEYIRKCLQHYADLNEGDVTAKSFLAIAGTFQDEVKHNSSKEEMGKAMSKHLMHNAKHYDFYEFLYFCKQ